MPLILYIQTFITVTNELDSDNVLRKLKKVSKIIKLIVKNSTAPTDFSVFLCIIDYK